MCANWESGTANTPCCASGQQVMQCRASAALSIPRAHPTVGPHHQPDSTTGLCFDFHTHTHVHIYIHTHLFIAGNLPSETKPAQEPNLPQPLSSPTGKDICSRFHLKLATLRWLQPLQDLDGGRPPQHSQHSHIPASNKPFSNKPWTCPTDATVPVAGCWRGGKGQQNSSAEAESSLVLQYAQKPVFGMGDHTLGKQSPLLIAQSRSTGMEKLTLKGKDWTEH